MKRFYLPLLVAAALLSASVLAGGAGASGSGRVPPHLAGHWAIPWAGGTEYLTLADSRFRFFFDHGARYAAHGQVSVSGDTITFYNSNQCTGTGTYQWSRSGGGLTFVQVPGSSDPCPRAAILTSGVWTRR
jgi:hypothetical protein